MMGEQFSSVFLRMNPPSFRPCLLSGPTSRFNDALRIPSFPDSFYCTSKIVPSLCAVCLTIMSL